MTPKEKAQELVNWFDDYKPTKLSDYSQIYYPTAKQFALKVCDEVLGYIGADRGYEFWTLVKKEIKNL
jgi:hypothetical protein